MTKLEFMKELESLLSDIPLEEREEALAYYNGYFEDAGENREEEIIQELGSPQRVAAIIKADLGTTADDLENRGYYTEKGYQDTVYEDEKYEIVDSGKNGESQRSQRAGHSNNGNSFGTNHSRNNNNTSGANNYNNNAKDRQGQDNPGAGQAAYQHQKNTDSALILLIALLTFPIWLPIAISIFATLFALIVGFGAAGIGMMVAGIALIIAGLIQITIPFMMLIFCGGGLLVFGLGMLFTLLCVILCKNVIPAFIRGFVNLCRLPFKNRSVMA